jgi:hypothetical protein
MTTLAVLDTPLVLWGLILVGWAGFVVGAFHVARTAHIPAPPRVFWITLAFAAAIALLFG